MLKRGSLRACVGTSVWTCWGSRVYSKAHTCECVNQAWLVTCFQTYRMQNERNSVISDPWPTLVPTPKLLRDSRMNEVKNKRARGNVSRMCMPLCWCTELHVCDYISHQTHTHTQTTISRHKHNCIWNLVMSDRTPSSIIALLPLVCVCVCVCVHWMAHEILRDFF